MNRLNNISYPSTKTWSVDNDIENLVNGYIHEHESVLSLDITFMLIKIILQFTQTDWIMKYDDGTRVDNFWWECISNSVNKFEWKPICTIITARFVSFGPRIQIIQPFYSKWFVTFQSRILMDRFIVYMKAPNGDNIFRIKINNYDQCRHITIGNKFFAIQIATNQIKQKDKIQFVLDLHSKEINMIIIGDNTKVSNKYQLPQQDSSSLLFACESDQCLNVVNYGYER